MCKKWIAPSVTRPSVSWKQIHTPARRAQTCIVRGALHNAMRLSARIVQARSWVMQRVPSGFSSGFRSTNSSLCGCKKNRNCLPLKRTLIGLSAQKLFRRIYDLEPEKKYHRSQKWASMSIRKRPCFRVLMKCVAGLSRRLLIRQNVMYANRAFAVGVAKCAVPITRAIQISCRTWKRLRRVPKVVQRAEPAFSKPRAVTTWFAHTVETIFIGLL